MLDLERLGLLSRPRVLLVVSTSIRFALVPAETRECDHGVLQKHWRIVVLVLGVIELLWLLVRHLDRGLILQFAS